MFGFPPTIDRKNLWKKYRRLELLDHLGSLAFGKKPVEPSQTIYSGPIEEVHIP